LKKINHESETNRGGVGKSHVWGLFKNVQMQGAQKTEPRDVYGYTLSDTVCSATQQMSVFQQSHSKPLIIPIFIMNSGCPHRCIFCNQKITAGNYAAQITKDFFDTEVKSYLEWNKKRLSKVEIAFYGGSFTGISEAFQKTLLSWASSYVEDGLVHSIRISTRPDYITEENLSLLKKYNVSTVEIGAQSFNDEVLRFARRGHDATATVLAIKTLKDHGFHTGLHLMAGLPKDTPDGFINSISKAIELMPETVRLHPLIVLDGTALAEEYRLGKYKPLELAEATDLCCLAWEKLSAAGIRVIRIGLQVTEAMEKGGTILAGPFHPAFGSLVLSSIFYNHTIKLLASIPQDTKELRFNLSGQDMSSFRGMANMNIAAIKKLYPHANLIVESISGQTRGEISVATDSGKSFNLKIPGII
jgi:histone acetyltransferase (RNA polymerase elongator complex component)